MTAAGADGAAVLGPMLGPMLGAGREADVHAWGESAVLKLYRPGYGGHRAEAAVLRALDGEGGAPRLLDIVDHDARTGLVLERVNGTDILTLLQRHPWRMPRLARALGMAHRGVHGVPAPAHVPDLREVLAARITDAELPPALFAFVMELLDGLPSGDRLCHGDFHPGNVLMAAGRTAVIDWVAATRGVPEADHARTLLLLRWADPLPNTALHTRALISTGRVVLAHRYATAYRRGAPPLRHVQSWLLVHAAARLTEGLAAERATLLSVLYRARRKD